MVVCVTPSMRSSTLGGPVEDVALAVMVVLPAMILPSVGAMKRTEGRELSTKIEIWA